MKHIETVDCSAQERKMYRTLFTNPERAATFRELLADYDQALLLAHERESARAIDVRCEINERVRSWLAPAPFVGLSAARMRRWRCVVVAKDSPAPGSMREMVDAIYARAGFSPAFAPGPEPLAQRLLGPSAIKWRSRTSGGTGSHPVILGDGTWQIPLDKDGTHEEWTVAIGRALARWWTGAILDLKTFDLVDSLGLRILFPDQSLRVAVELIGWDAEEIADRTALPEHRMAQRICSLTGRRSRKSGPKGFRVIDGGSCVSGNPVTARAASRPLEVVR